MRAVAMELCSNPEIFPAVWNALTTVGLLHLLMNAPLLGTNVSRSRCLATSQTDIIFYWAFGQSSLKLTLDILNSQSLNLTHSLTAMILMFVVVNSRLLEAHRKL